MSSVIYCLNGPLFPVAIILIVGIPFLGYIPHLNVPPQSIITAIISSSGTDVSKPLTTSAPVISAILSTISGLCPPVI